MTELDYIRFQKTEFTTVLGQLRSTQYRYKELMASIIIVNYNGWRDLDRCLRSLEASQTQEYEIIVVDNCSTDGSPEQIEKYYPYVRLVRCSFNLGFGGGNNLGAQLAQGRILVFLNPDTTVEKGWLEPLLHTLDNNQNVGMVTSRVLLMSDPTRVNTCGNDLHVSGLTLCRGMGKPATYDTHRRRVAAVSGAAFAIRRLLFEIMGGFDETFFLYMEDTDLSLRVQIAGYQCVLVPDSVVYHDYTLRFGQMKTYYQERNRYLMLLKCLHWRSLVLITPALVLSEVITWGFVLLRDRARITNKLLAYVWILFWWPEIMQKRAVTQKYRRATDRSILMNTTTRLDFAQTNVSAFIARLANLIFDPLFILQRWTVQSLLWW